MELGDIGGDATGDAESADIISTSRSSGETEREHTAREETGSCNNEDVTQRMAISSGETENNTIGETDAIISTESDAGQAGTDIGGVVAVITAKVGTTESDETDNNNRSETLSELVRRVSLSDSSEATNGLRLEDDNEVIDEENSLTQASDEDDERTKIYNKLFSSLTCNRSGKELDDKDVDQRPVVKDQDNNYEASVGGIVDVRRTTTGNDINANDAVSPTQILMVDKTPDIVGCNSIFVTKCGVSEIDGRYHRFECSDGIPSYSKIGTFEGKEVMFTIGRWETNSGTKKWYITGTVPGGNRPKQYAYYVAYAPSRNVALPPEKGWMVVVDGNELFLAPKYKGAGIDPVPAIELESDEIRLTKSLGMQISAALSVSSSRALSATSIRRRRDNESRSLPSIGSVSTESYHDNVPPMYLPPSLLTY